MAGATPLRDPAVFDLPPNQSMVIAYLLQAGADFRMQDKDGDTVMHFACMKTTPQGSHENALKILLSSPASSLTESQNCRGDTPLLVATRYVFAYE